MLLLLWQLLLLLLRIVKWQTVAIGECQAIEVSKFTHYFWYLITFRTEANQAAAANACAANAAADDAVMMQLVMLLQIVAVMMIVMRMCMRMRMMMMMAVTVTVVVIVTVMMLMANGGRAIAQCCIIACAAAIQLLWSFEGARLAHLQTTLAALLLRRRFALTECIQIGSYKLRLQCLGRRNGCAVIFTSWWRR